MYSLNLENGYVTFLPPVQLGDEQVVVLHTEGELLHVDIVDGSVAGAEEEEGAGCVVGGDGGQLLGLPVLGQAVPHPDTTWGQSC